MSSPAIVSLKKPLIIKKKFIFKPNSPLLLTSTKRPNNNESPLPSPKRSCLSMPDVGQSTPNVSMTNDVNSEKFTVNKNNTNVELSSTSLKGIKALEQSKKEFDVILTLPNNGRSKAKYYSLKKTSCAKLIRCSKHGDLPEHQAEGLPQLFEIFNSPDEFFEYSSEHAKNWFFYYSRVDSRNSKNRPRYNSRKPTYFHFSCRFNKKFYKSQSKGIRKIRTGKIAVDCPAGLTLRIGVGENKCTVWDVCHHHSHELSADIFSEIPHGYRLPQEIKDEIRDLALFNVKHLIARRYIESKVPNIQLRRTVYNMFLSAKRKGPKDTMSPERVKEMLAKIKYIKANFNTSSPQTKKGKKHSSEADNVKKPQTKKGSTPKQSKKKIARQSEPGDIPYDQDMSFKFETDNTTPENGESTWEETLDEVPTDKVIVEMNDEPIETSTGATNLETTTNIFDKLMPLLKPKPGYIKKPLLISKTKPVTLNSTQKYQIGDITIRKTGTTPAEVFLGGPSFKLLKCTSKQGKKFLVKKSELSGLSYDHELMQNVKYELQNAIHENEENAWEQTTDEVPNDKVVVEMNDDSIGTNTDATKFKTKALDNKLLSKPEPEAKILRTIFKTEPIAPKSSKKYQIGDITIQRGESNNEFGIPAVVLTGESERQVTQGQLLTELSNLERAIAEPHEEPPVVKKIIRPMLSAEMKCEGRHKKLPEQKAEGLVQLNDTFSSVEEFTNYANAHALKWFFYYRIADSRNVLNTPRYDKYRQTFYYFTCRYNKKSYKYQGKGLRRRVHDAVRCPATVTMKCNPGDDKFRVTYVCHHHSHELSREMFSKQGHGSKLSPELKEEIHELGWFGLDTRIIKLYIHNKVGIDMKFTIKNILSKMKQDKLELNFSPEKRQEILNKIEDIKEKFPIPKRTPQRMKKRINKKQKCKKPESEDEENKSRVDARLNNILYDQELIQSVKELQESTGCEIHINPWGDSNMSEVEQSITHLQEGLVENSEPNELQLPEGEVIESQIEIDQQLYSIDDNVQYIIPSNDDGTIIFEVDNTIDIYSESVGETVIEEEQFVENVQATAIDNAEINQIHEEEENIQYIDENIFIVQENEEYEASQENVTRQHYEDEPTCEADGTRPENEEYDPSCEVLSTGQENEEYEPSCEADGTGQENEVYEASCEVALTEQENEEYEQSCEVAVTEPDNEEYELSCAVAVTKQDNEEYELSCEADATSQENEEYEQSCEVAVTEPDNEEYELSCAVAVTKQDNEEYELSCEADATSQENEEYEAIFENEEDDPVRETDDEHSEGIKYENMFEYTNDEDVNENERLVYVEKSNETYVVRDTGVQADFEIIELERDWERVQKLESIMIREDMEQSNLNVCTRGRPKIALEEGIINRFNVELYIGIGGIIPCLENLANIMSLSVLELLKKLYQGEGVIKMTLGRSGKQNRKTVQLTYVPLTIAFPFESFKYNNGLQAYKTMCSKYSDVAIRLENTIESMSTELNDTKEKLKIAESQNTEFLKVMETHEFLVKSRNSTKVLLKKCQEDLSQAQAEKQNLVKKVTHLEALQLSSRLKDAEILRQLLEPKPDQKDLGELKLENDLLRESLAKKQVKLALINKIKSLEQALAVSVADSKQYQETMKTFKDLYLADTQSLLDKIKLLENNLKTFKTDKSKKSNIMNNSEQQSIKVCKELQNLKELRASENKQYTEKIKRLYKRIFLLEQKTKKQRHSKRGEH